MQSFTAEMQGTSIVFDDDGGGGDGMLSVNQS